ncbi:MAG: TIGR02757 family protein [Chitinophagales bacterium]|nr:TIGR02757 family protein [Chitinophagales bacterium]MCZ2393884.1 TIGR02757 family protein [Chitinophagales bacterium]
MKVMNIAETLEFYYQRVHHPTFIENDPISIPHLFSKKQDIEIMGLIAAILAWGQRKTIINSCNKIVNWMDGSPHDFILNHQEKDLARFESFVHRTFNGTDMLSFIAFFKQYYQKHESLETAFSRHLFPTDENIGPALIGFHNYFMALATTAPRTKKHISSPIGKSTCKRLNMFLRWMVRKDDKGIDFGIWTQISSSQLLCPLDVHVEKNARQLRLIQRKQTDWQTVLELTQQLKKFDSIDPVRFDFALFGMGILAKEEKFLLY